MNKTLIIDDEEINIEVSSQDNSKCGPACPYMHIIYDRFLPMAQCNLFGIVFRTEHDCDRCAPCLFAKEKDTK